MKIILIIQTLIIIVLFGAVLWRGFDCTESPWDTQHSYPDKTFFQVHAVTHDDKTIIKYILFSQIRGEMVELQGKSRIWPKESPDYLRLRVGAAGLVNIHFAEPFIKVIHIDSTGGINLYNWKASHDDYRAFFQPHANAIEESVSAVLDEFLAKQQDKLM
jgi:hypothetical protein